MSAYTTSLHAAPAVATAAFEFLRRTPSPSAADKHEHAAARASYWERVANGRAPAHAVAILTAVYDLALWELDGVQNTAFARNKAFFAGVDADSPWTPVMAMASYVAEVEAGFFPAKSPPVGLGGDFLPAPDAAPWSEWRSPSEAALVPLYTVVPVRILQDQNGRTLVETA